MDGIYTARDHLRGKLRHYAIEGCEFAVCICVNGVIGEIRCRHFVDAIKDACTWVDRVDWVCVNDFEGKTIVFPKRIRQLQSTPEGLYGVVCGESAYTIRGPTLNPTYFAEYDSLDVLEALEFALQWQDNNWESPYWVEIRGPNGEVILPQNTLERMYHAVLKSKGDILEGYALNFGPNGMEITDYVRIV